MKFEDLKFKPHPAGFGEQAKVEFANKYGASIVTGSDHFYVSAGEPYELAVTYEDHLTYETPITDDVMGHLTKEDVEEILDQIEALPPKENQNETE